jgi:hypothetical protein
MHKTTARMPPTPKLAVLSAPPVNWAELGLTGDALGLNELMGEPPATTETGALTMVGTGTTLIVWTTITKVLLDALGTALLATTVGLAEPGFETAF